MNVEEVMNGLPAEDCRAIEARINELNRLVVKNRSAARKREKQIMRTLKSVCWGLWGREPSDKDLESEIRRINE